MAISDIGRRCQLSTDDNAASLRSFLLLVGGSVEVIVVVEEIRREIILPCRAKQNNSLPMPLAACSHTLHAVRPPCTVFVSVTSSMFTISTRFSYRHNVILRQ